MQHSKLIPYQGAQVEVDVVSDRYWMDYAQIVSGQTKQEYFVSRAGKDYDQAVFEGDQTLVPEGRLAEIIGISFHCDQAVLSFDDIKNIFVGAYFEWQINEVTTDRDWLFRLIGGVDLFDSSGTVAPFQGDGAHANIRKYAISRFAPGGRSIKFNVYWPAGVTLQAPVSTRVNLYGYEEIPREVALA